LGSLGVGCSREGKTGCAAFGERQVHHAPVEIPRNHLAAGFVAAGAPVTLPLTCPESRKSFSAFSHWPAPSFPACPSSAPVHVLALLLLPAAGLVYSWDNRARHQRAIYPIISFSAAPCPSKAARPLLVAWMKLHGFFFTKVFTLSVQPESRNAWSLAQARDVSDSRNITE